MVYHGAPSAKCLIKQTLLQNFGFVIFIHGIVSIASNITLQENRPESYYEFDNISTRSPPVLLRSMDTQITEDKMKSDSKRISENMSSSLEVIKDSRKIETIDISDCALEFLSKKLTDFENFENVTKIFQYELNTGISLRQNVNNYSLETTIELLRNKTEKLKDDRKKAIFFSDGHLLGESVQKNVTVKIPAKTKFTVFQTIVTCGEIFDLYTPDIDLQAKALHTAANEQDVPEEDEESDEIDEFWTGTKKTSLNYSIEKHNYDYFNSEESEEHDVSPNCSYLTGSGCMKVSTRSGSMRVMTISDINGKYSGARDSMCQISYCNVQILIATIFQLATLDLVC